MAKTKDIPMLLRTSDANGFVRQNDAFEKIVGFSTSELASKPFSDWLVLEDKDYFRSLLDGKKDDCRVRHLTKEGGTFELTVRFSSEEKGSILLASLPDTSDRFKESDEAEATVKSTLHTIAQIVEDQNPGFKCSILLVADGRFVKGAGPSLPDDYNNAIDGHAVGPTVGSCGTAIYWNHPVIVEDIQADPLWVPFAELAKKAGVAACWSHPFISKGGRVLGALALYSPKPNKPTDEQLSRLKAAARMTGLAVERGRAEEALREQRKRELELEDQLRQAAKMKALGVLAGGIAHDFNNILASILVNAEFAQTLLPGDSKITKNLGDIVSACNRAGGFCKQMLAYAGRGSIATQEIEFGELIKELDSLVQAAITKKIQLKYDLQKESAHIQGDENQLLQVIMNLVTNAAEAIGEKEGEIVVSSKVENFDKPTLEKIDPEQNLKEGNYLRLDVSDTGCGMDKETAAKIFDPFYTTKDTGHGLGLSAVKGIVKLHNGTMYLESQQGFGTTFTVLLPTIIADDKPIEKNEPQNLGANGNKRVLLADDEVELRSAMVMVLEHNGYEVVEAVDGQEAFNSFITSEDSFGCVLLDLNMPKLNGEEVARKIRQVDKDVPIILASGYSEQEVTERFNDLNISQALQKPTPINQLLAAVNEATNHSRDIEEKKVA